MLSFFVLGLKLPEFYLCRFQLKRASSVFHQQEEKTDCEQTSSWTGHSSRASSVGWTSTPQLSAEFGCLLFSSSGSWCLWWQPRRYGVMNRKTSNATRLSLGATMSAMTTSSPSLTSGCGPCSSSSSPAPLSWWWCMLPTGRTENGKTGWSTVKTAADSTRTPARSVEACGGPTSSLWSSK